MAQSLQLMGEKGDVGAQLPLSRLAAEHLIPVPLCLLKGNCKQQFPTFFVGLSLVFLLTQIFPSACQLLMTPNSGLMTFLCLGVVLYLHHNRAL